MTEFNSRNRPTRRDMFFVPFENLQVIEDYNVRYDYGDIKELAASIAEHGIKVPLRGYKKGDVYFITAGHRRYKAMQLLASKGYAEIFAPFISEEKGYTDEQRIFDLILTNEGKRLTMLEEMVVYNRLIALGWTPKKMSKAFGKSITHVDNCLLLNKAPEELLEKIKADTISATVVIEMLRKQSGDDVVKKVEEAEEKLSESGSSRTKVTAKDLEPAKPKINISKELAKMLEEVKEESVNKEVDEVALLFAERLLEYYNGGASYEDMKEMFFVKEEEE